MLGIEPKTSSLPRKRSTPELHRLVKLSERPGSNRRPSAWKADALPTELLPLLKFEISFKNTSILRYYFKEPHKN